MTHAQIKNLSPQDLRAALLQLRQEKEEEIRAQQGFSLQDAGKPKIKLGGINTGVETVGMDLLIEEFEKRYGKPYRPKDTGLINTLKDPRSIKHTGATVATSKSTVGTVSLATVWLGYKEARAEYQEIAEYLPEIPDYIGIGVLLIGGLLVMVKALELLNEKSGHAY